MIDKNKKTIIVLFGNYNSGKTTVGNLIHQFFTFKTDKHSFQYSFAEPLKKCLSALFNISDKQLEEQKKSDFRIRCLLKKIADEVKNLYSDEYFALQVIKQINTNSNIDVHIITDLRFDIEYRELEKLKSKYNIIYIKVECDESKKDDYCLFDELKADLIIDNNQEFTELTKNVEQTIKKEIYDKI